MTLPLKFFHVGSRDIAVSTVSVDRATDACVWINGRRNHRRSAYDNYFERYDDARNFLVDKYEKLAARTAKNLQEAEQRLEKAKLIPTGAELERMKS